jgi:hypothetical protein
MSVPEEILPPRSPQDEDAETQNAVANFISKHSVALLVPDKSWPGRVRPVASGSLVKFDDRRFILTATHVWVALRGSSSIYYSAIANISHARNLPTASLIPYSLDDNVKEEPEPFCADLTLLELHPIDYRPMEARFSFFQLEREGTGPIGDHVIVGCPGVLARRDPTRIDTLSFELRAVFVRTVTDEKQHDGIDFLKSMPYPDPNSPIDKYWGFSGGGLWSVYYYPEKLGDERYDVYLIGVNFFQTDKEIRSLGRKAINKLIGNVRMGTPKK